MHVNKFAMKVLMGEGEVAAVFGEVGLGEELVVGRDLRGLELGGGGVGAKAYGIAVLCERFTLAHSIDNASIR